jgi:hypothetical protein
MGIAARESIQRARLGTKKTVSWAGRFMSMLYMFSGKGSRDEADTVKNFVDQFGFDAAADPILPLPSGVVWNAYDRFMAEPWEGLAVNPRNADATTVRLATYNSWFAVAKDEQEKGYPECMPAYVKHTGGIPFDQVKHLMRLRAGAHHLRIETGRWLNTRFT